MSSPLLTTKLNLPRLPQRIVTRRRLIELLDEGAALPLTLLSAPAGSGKTTLLAEWLHHTTLPAAWLSLDEDDNDLARFLRYLIAALGSIRPDLGEEVLAGLQPSLLRQTLILLLNDIAAIPDPFVIIFDDYQSISEQAIHDAMSYLIEHLPPQMHLVLASRSDPPLRLAQLRARRNMREIRSADLRFTEEEADQFLKAVMGLDLSAENIQALQGRTEGWIAGLQLAALSMRAREDLPGFIREFAGSHAYVVDYLTDEVLDRLSQERQAFLLQTSVLERLSASLCDAVTGRRDSLRLLSELERDNLFINSLDDQRHWYRYHPLFADLLQQRLVRMCPDEVQALHEHAGRWYEAHDMLSDAIEHALAAEDHPLAADLLERVAESLLMRSEVTTFNRWINALAEEVLHRHPRLCAYHAGALLLSGAPLHAIEARLANAETGEENERIPAVEVFRAVIDAFQGEVALGAQRAAWAFKHLPQDSPFLRSVGAWATGLVMLMDGDASTAQQAFEEASHIARGGGNLLIAVMTMCNLAELNILWGNLDHGGAIYRQALDLAVDANGRLLPIAGMAQVGLGELLREKNQLEAALHLVNEGIQSTEGWGIIASMDGYISLASIRQAQGDPEGARRALEKAERIAVQFDTSEMDDLFVDLNRLRLFLLQGDLEAFGIWLERHGRHDASSSAAFELEGEHLLAFHLNALLDLTIGRYYLAQGQAERALELLERVLSTSVELRWLGGQIEALAVRALAYQARDESAQAMLALERALALAEPRGYVRLFVDLGQPMAHLLRQATSQGIHFAYIARLLEAFSGIPASAARREAQPALVDPLSQRELEVLRLLAAGLSNPEIAERLYVTLNTVKWHTKNIYGKLQVHNRTEAVIRAQDLHIL